MAGIKTSEIECFWKAEKIHVRDLESQFYDLLSVVHEQVT